MRILLAFVIVAIFPISGFGQKVMKEEVKITPLTSGGVPVGCSMEYLIMVSDRVYRSGGVVGLTGTYAWISNRDRNGIAGMFKLGVVDFDNAMRKSWVKPATTILRAGGETHPPQSFIQCEDAKYTCGAYSTEASLAVLSGILEGPVQIGFNRKKAGFDVLATIEFSYSHMSALADCMREFMRSLDDFDR